jgi:hypothetical protein
MNRYISGHVGGLPRALNSSPTQRPISGLVTNDVVDRRHLAIWVDIISLRARTEKTLRVTSQ